MARSHRDGPLFRHAIVRPPAPNFADGLTTVDLGAPDVVLALAQHEVYCQALAACGLALERLPEDARHADSTFVEDTAVIVPGLAVLTRPGAPSRSGEAEAIRPSLAWRFPDLREIVAPGTVDGGDICEAGETVFLGLSHRTNAEGCRQLGALLVAAGYRAPIVDVRAVPSILHLKSGVSWLGGDHLLVIPELADEPGFSSFERLIVAPEESYAANCVLVNDRVLVPDGFPVTATAIAALGLEPLPLPVSEFRKMDGGLSCLSLRF